MSKYTPGTDRAEVNINDFQRKKGCTPKKTAIVFGALIVLAGIVAVVVYFAAFHNKNDDDSMVAAVEQDTTTRESTTKPVPKPTAKPTIHTTTESLPAPSPTGLRIDCLIDKLVKAKADCEIRNCSWDETATEDGDKCSLLSTRDIGNMLMDVVQMSDAVLLKLSWSGEKRSLFSKSEDIIENITVEISELNENMLRIKFLDTDDSSRFTVPLPLNLPASSSQPKNYNVSWSNIGEKFYIQVTRLSDSTVIFATDVADLVMEKQYLSLSAQMPTGNVYGLGENLHKTFRHQFKKAETWAMFARDQPPGQDSNQHYDNLYGVHPFYVCIENSGNAHGVFLLNSNAQDITLTPGHMITYRTIGGILDFFIFTGPTPENVIQQYTGLVGRPYMPPYWSLGFQLCRYGYTNTEDIRAAVNRTHSKGIPHDVQYADIDYMEARKDFTIDSANFADLANYFQELRGQHNMRTIIILDPALSIQDGYPIYPEGKSNNIYIKWPSDNSSAICAGCKDDQYNMLGYVWPDNRTVFPDFFKNSTKELWKQWIVAERGQIEFDGLWIDMNEPANFDTNKDRPWNWEAQRPNEPDWNLKCDMSLALENPPYKTKACHIYANELRNISDKTLCMVGVQGENDEYTHYDVHNLYGWSQTEPTLTALREAVGGNKRGMVITRSTFAGSGKYAGHWLGDNTANWEHLRESIIGMLEFNMFGIPYVGADICGFFGNSTAELCKRWMQLGAFYPFSRNHNGIGYIDQDPAAFDDETVALLSRSSLLTRYALLPYLYTLFYNANLYGNTVVRSLQFEWPADGRTHNISEQFLWGKSILFSPILYENQTTVTAYLPEGKWYDLYFGGIVSEDGEEDIQIAVNEISEIPIHIRGGSIIPLKLDRASLTTADSRNVPFSLIITLDKNEAASGELFWDNGESIDTVSANEYCLMEFTAANQYVNSTVKLNGCVPESTGSPSLNISTMVINGLTGNVTNVTLGGNPVGFRYNDGVLLVTRLMQLITDEFSMHWF